MVFRLQYALLVLLLVGTALSARERPNVVLVTVDTVRADRIGCYGYPKGETPNLDQLAREGVRFEQAFSPVPLTLPAHASILTGTYPSYHGVRDNSGFILAPEHPTLAPLLKTWGYSTGAFVGAYVLDSKFGLSRGFDYYYDQFDLDRYQNVSPGIFAEAAIRSWARRSGGSKTRKVLPSSHGFICTMRTTRISRRSLSLRGTLGVRMMELSHSWTRTSEFS